MRRVARDRMVFLFPMVVLGIFGCGAHRIAPVATGATDLAPTLNWRYLPGEIQASGNAYMLDSLRAGGSAEWKVADSDNPWFAFQADSKPDKILITFKTGVKKAEAFLEMSRDSEDGRGGTWRLVDWRTTGPFLEKLECAPEKGAWYRVRFDFANVNEVPEGFQVSDIGLYEIEEGRQHDYWLVIGASIQWQSIRQDVFHTLVTQNYPGYDPIVFNLAVSGWKTDNLLKALPGFLEEHPDASYVCIHIGGNNVSANRPYPGGAETLQSELESILKTIADSGKIPILSRLSYRAYKSDPPVPPEDNGSGPYVQAIYDPLIKEYCPRFYDPVRERGVVDAYTWFKEHPEELSSDGIHVNDAGKRSWNRLWVDNAGSVVYRGEHP